MRKGLICVFMIIFLIFPVFFAKGMENGEKPTRLLIGMVLPENAQVFLENIEPFTRILSQELGIHVYVDILANYTDLLKALSEKRVDLGFFGPFGMVLAQDLYDVEFLVNTMRFETNQFRAQFNVAEGSEIKSLEDLRGKMVAFVDQTSPLGYLFPYVYLKNNIGLDPEVDFSYIFSGTHKAAILAVYEGKVDCSVTFVDARNTVIDEYSDIMEKVIVIGYTDYIPGDGIVARKELDDEFLAKVKKAFLALGDSEEEQAILKNICNATGFAETTKESYQIVRMTYEEMKDKIIPSEQPDAEPDIE